MATKSKMNVAEKIIEAHMVSGDMTPGEEVGIKIDQGLCQDTLGLLTALTLEALDKEPVSV